MQRVRQQLIEQRIDLLTNMSKWNISNNTSRKKYQASIFDCFSNWNSDSFNNINEIWSSIKSWIITAGTKSVGFTSYNSKQIFWQKEVEKLIQDHTQANRLYRVISEHPNFLPELLTLLCEDYLKRCQWWQIKLNTTWQPTRRKLSF